MTGIRSEWEAERDLDRNWPAPAPDPIASARTRLLFIPDRIREARRVIADHKIGMRDNPDAGFWLFANRAIAKAEAEIAADEAERDELTALIAAAHVEEIA